MRIFFDHNIPRKPRRTLKGHFVAIAAEMGWDTLENGDLLRAVEDAGFEVFVTADKDLSYQQNPSGRKLALVVLSTNNWKIIQRNTAVVVSAVNAATPGSFQIVTISPIKSH